MLFVVEGLISVVFLVCSIFVMIIELVELFGLMIVVIGWVEIFMRYELKICLFGVVVLDILLCLVGVLLVINENVMVFVFEGIL